MNVRLDGDVILQQSEVLHWQAEGAGSMEEVRSVCSCTCNSCNPFQQVNSRYPDELDFEALVNDIVADELPSRLHQIYSEYQTHHEAGSRQSISTTGAETMCNQALVEIALSSKQKKKFPRWRRHDTNIPPLAVPAPAPSLLGPNFQFPLIR